MRVLLLTGQHTNYPGKWPIFDFENGWPILYFKGMKTQKYMFFLYYVKIGVENEFEIRFVQFDLFKEKIGIFNRNSISGKNNSEKS